MVLKYEIDTLLHAHNARKEYDKLYKQKQHIQQQISDTLLKKDPIKSELLSITEHMKKEVYHIKTLIKESSLYTDVISPYESIMTQETKDEEKGSLAQIPYFKEFYKTIGMLTQTQEKTDQNTIKKIFTIRNFIQ